MKRGEHGTVGFDNGQRVKVSAFTVAAGDTVSAGYLTELITGQPLDQRLRTVAACDAIACTAAGRLGGRTRTRRPIPPRPGAQRGEEGKDAATDLLASCTGSPKEFHRGAQSWTDTERAAR